MTHVVTRPLSTKDEVLQPGTEVDASTWRNARLLEEQRYLKPIQPDGRTKRMGRKEQDGDTRQ